MKAKTKAKAKPAPVKPKAGVVKRNHNAPTKPEGRMVAISDSHTNLAT